MRINLWRERIVVQLGFASAEIRLDEHTASTAVRDDSLQTSFEDATATKNYNSRNDTIQGESLICVSW